MASSFSPSFEKWENPLTKFIDRSSHEHFRASVLESLCCKSNVPQITKKIRATTTNQAQETKTRRHLPSDSYQLVAVQNSSKNRRDVDVYLPSWNTNTNVHIFRYKFTMDQVGLRTYSWLNNIVPKKTYWVQKKRAGVWPKNITRLSISIIRSVNEIGTYYGYRCLSPPKLLLSPQP